MTLAHTNQNLEHLAAFRSLKIDSSLKFLGFSFFGTGEGVDQPFPGENTSNISSIYKQYRSNVAASDALCHCHSSSHNL